MHDLPPLILALGSLITAIAGAVAVILPLVLGIRRKVKQIEVNTNSITDKLVATTAKIEHAAGVVVGRAQAKEERDRL